MPPISAEELRTHFARALPGIVVPTAAPAAAPAKHGEGHANMLATKDTVVVAERLIEAATYLRDTLGYTLLSDIAAVDYLADHCIEVVYRFYHLEGGPSLVLKVRVPRDEPTIPSLTPTWPGADFHEREIFDLFGVIFAQHPYLHRIYMWDEFEGYPMRKDFPRQGDKYIGSS